MFERTKSIGKHLRLQLNLYRLLPNDNRTPKLSKILFGLALGYALFPLDIILDFVPVIGQISDMIIVLALILLALKLVPNTVYQECRNRVIEP
jgi:uncharacterized membrane protein YkvA (DUF1232 family)